MVKSNIFSRVLWTERISDELKWQRSTLRRDTSLLSKVFQIKWARFIALLIRLALAIGGTEELLHQ